MLLDDGLHAVLGGYGCQRLDQEVGGAHLHALVDPLGLRLSGEEDDREVRAALQLVDALHDREAAGAPLQADIQHDYGEGEHVFAHLIDALRGGSGPENTVIFFENFVEYCAIQFGIVNN